MNKIRVIDLLNKIANGEELPKQIKYNKHEYDLVNRQYLEDDLSGLDLVYLDELNDEVEIIEEETEDSEIPNIDFDNMKDIGIIIGKAYRDFYEALIEGWDNK